MKAETNSRSPEEAYRFQRANQELYEARIIVPEWELEAFLTFCEEKLGQVPQLSRAGTIESPAEPVPIEAIALVRKHKTPPHGPTS